VILPKEKENILTYVVSYLSSYLDNNRINNAIDHFIGRHLTSSLVSFRNNFIKEGHIAKSIGAADNFRRYSFKLKKAYWSNGDLIEVDDIIASISRNIRLNPKTMHYNFSNIENILKITDDSFDIFLKQTDPFFLTRLSDPEWRIVSREDAIQPLFKQTFNVTSGAYTLLKYSQDEVLLKKNTYFGHKNNYPDILRIITYPHKEKFINILNTEEADILITPHSLSTLENYEEISKHKKYTVSRTNSVYTFWISLNGNTLDFKYRKFMQSILNVSSFKNDEQYDKIFRKEVISEAKKLYFTENVVEPQEKLHEKELQTYWKSLKKIKNPCKEKNISILIHRNFQLKKQIKDSLDYHNINYKIYEYTNFSEFFEMTENNIFDLVQVNNNCSDFDHTDSLRSCFNPAKALIFPEKNDMIIKSYLENLEEEINHEKRKEVANNIEIYIIKTGYIIPMYYFFFIVYHKKTIKIPQNLDELNIWEIVY